MLLFGREITSFWQKGEIEIIKKNFKKKRNETKAENEVKK